MGKVYLTNFIVDGKSIDFMKEEFSVPYSQNSFSLEFSMLNYKNDEDIISSIVSMAVIGYPLMKAITPFLSRSWRQAIIA